ncbi:OmpA family protein [Leucothrix pacifica]|uniref:Cell envelope biogenesis protein OmpA n=1 Tax=Leucothrix pacifica TaxID=1247513 RepID=A0A317CLK6_9GAMM|nr:OmpA family protein [Leucothrix pacifica]PWQ99465.1 cell envelope biogenesis protein OmpA [Leucothrix pacifica]
MLDSIIGKTSINEQEDDNQWLSVSDLMAGLMMVFLFISIVLMRNALIERDNVKELAETYQVERDKVKEIAAAYQDNKVRIYDALMSEFRSDLVLWDAAISKKDLSFNFQSPEVLFDIGEISVKPTFQRILDDFFPRYLSVINKFKGSIEEVRIEGHTSSRWGSGASIDDAYFKNMDLSQGRTRSVLSYVYNIESVRNQRQWIKENIAAVGYSSSKRIIINGSEDVKRSRRVTFRLITNSETQILKIIEG